MLSLFVDAILMYIIFIILRLYTSVWKFASVTELLNVIYGCMMIEICSVVFHYSFSLMMPRSFYIIRLLLMIIFVGGSRFSFRIIRTLIIRHEGNHRKKNTMIIGAGSAGRLLIEELHYNNNSDEKIVCVIDDNKNLKGTYFKNIPVCGGRKSIVSSVEKYKVEDISYIASPLRLEFVSYIECIKSIINAITIYPIKLTKLVHIVLFIVMIIVYANVIRSKNYDKKTKILITILFLIIPFGMNITYILDGGYAHDMMKYAYWFIYVFILILVCDAFAMSEIKEKSKEILKILPCILVFSMLWGNTQLANETYLKKDIESKATLAYMNRVLQRGK